MLPFPMKDPQILQGIDKYLLICIFQEPIHIRNHELLVLKTQLQRKVEELQRELTTRNARINLQPSPPRVSTPVDV